MNIQSMFPVQRSLFQSSTLNLVAMLLCVFTTLAILTTCANDQTGATLAELKASFESSLRDQGQGDALRIAAAFRHQLNVLRNETDNASPRGNGLVSTLRNSAVLARRTSESETEDDHGRARQLVDVNGPVFRNLTAELTRYCDVSPVTEAGRQLAFDLQTDSELSEVDLQAAVQQIVDVANSRTLNGQLENRECEIVVWASSPATVELTKASEQAYAVQQSLRTESKAATSNRMALTSSGRIWTRPNSARPHATVIVRAVRKRNRPL